MRWPDGRKDGDTVHIVNDPGETEMRSHVIAPAPSALALGGWIQARLACGGHEKVYE